VDVMDAIYRNPHITHLHFYYRTAAESSSLWREGSMGHNAVMVLLREKKSVTNITIDSDHSDISSFGNVLEQCIHLEHLTLQFNSRRSDQNIGGIIEAICHLPCIRSVTFERAYINGEIGMAISNLLIPKRSMNSLRMQQCTVRPEASTAIVQALKSDTDCTLRDVSLFIEHFPIFLTNPDRSMRVHEYMARDHYFEIRLALRYNARVQSLTEFVRLVTTRDINEVTVNTEFEDIEEAILRDEADFYWRNRPDHLLSLLRAKPEYVKRFIEHDAVYSVSSKRQKLN
jgi:hypothetical protein